ncbi:hypothetical protein IE81DRAFT_103546 [Ceraceosorus guamensis]|uniref:Uncharacterized protein n=1 Tax=Ceraceosorus guamensis TaxID=1522189 RepID=A0A316VZX8_9BASI|nr:hypothetical protein IE81DRAFT_103546 [Ceraceosorus guamensis]PWN43080.1 hypothetical protein IE81DRAFT_103546 [Ceraceosorus guamensis]
MRIAAARAPSTTKPLTQAPLVCLCLHLVGHPGMSTMGVGPQVGGIMRRSTVEQIQGPQAKAEPLQRREMINYDLGRPGHDRFGQPMIVSSGGDVLADYHKLYGCGAGNIIPCPKGSSEKKRASDMHPKTPTKPKAEPIPDGDNPRESWKFHQRGPRHFDEPYHMDRHLDLFGGPEKIKAVAASTPASEPTHAKSHLEHHDKEQEKAGGVKKSMEFQEFTPAQMAQFQKQHYSSADGHFGHSLPAVRRHLGGKESVGHKFTEAELEEYKQTHHNFGTRSPEKVEKITRHGSYSTTNVPNKSAEWEAEHTQKGGKHGFNSKVDEGPAYLGGEPGVGSDGKFDPDLYRKTCYPGLKKGMYTAQQNICNGAF